MSLKVRNFTALSSMHSGFTGHPGAVYNLTSLFKHCEACIHAKYTSDQASRALFDEVERGTFSPLVFVLFLIFVYMVLVLSLYLWGRLL